MRFCRVVEDTLWEGRWEMREVKGVLQLAGVVARMGIGANCRYYSMVPPLGAQRAHCNFG